MDRVREENSSFIRAHLTEVHRAAGRIKDLERLLKQAKRDHETLKNETPKVRKMAAQRLHVVKHSLSKNWRTSL